MKNIMIIIDGMHDDNIEQLGYVTPFQAAAASNIEYMQKKGFTGLFDTCPKGFNVDSLTCILTLLGQDKSNIPKGRAYLEAISEGLTLRDREVIMRCNLISLDPEGNLSSSTGGNLTELEYNKLFKKYENTLEKNKFRMHHMSAYKNLLIIRDENLEIIEDYPPHENIGREFKKLLPHQKILKEFILQSFNILNEHEKKYGFLPWGLSKKTIVPSFTELHNIKAASICHTEIVRGISIAMGMYTPKLKNATADIDTDLFEKANMALELIENYDFVLVHVNGADEAGHRRNALEKAKFIKKIDTELIGSILNKVDEKVNLLITSDHSTLCKSGKHRADLQPFVLYNNKRINHEDLGIINGKLAIKLIQSCDNY